ncbi:MAG: prolipoprotein diacylglyceryl transferase [Fidelibacterota bacterium]
MYPILIKIGSFTIHTYGVLHALSFIAGYIIARIEAKKAGIDQQHIGTLLFHIIIWSIIGSRIFSVIFDGNLNWYLKNPHEIFMIWKGGLTYYGGFIFSIFVVLWYIRKYKLPGWELTDTLVIGLPLAIAIARLGCLASGDSYGKPTALPWAITFTDPHAMAPVGIPLHPAQLYSFLTNILIFGVMWIWKGRKRFSGELFFIFLILYGITRSLVEIFRDDPRGVYFGGFISTSQIISLIIVIFAIILLIKKNPGSMKLMNNPDQHI